MKKTTLAAPIAVAKERLTAIQKRLQVGGWVHDADFDYAPIVTWAMENYYPKKRARAEAMVAKAARRLRYQVLKAQGKAPSVNGGRPPKSDAFPRTTLDKRHADLLNSILEKRGFTRREWLERAIESDAVGEK